VVFDDMVPQVRPGMTADVSVDVGTHAHTLAVPIQAVVVRTQRELDRAAKKPGQRERASRKAALAVTVSADEDTVGRRDKEITGVFVVRNGVAQYVPVRAGLASETMIEIFGDVKEGDTVISGPYKALRDLKPGGKVKKETGAKEKK